MTDFLIYDVFTDTPFGGNQLAIIPDARALPETDLQKIAREFNFSETTFVCPTDNVRDQAQVRIFTPTMEIPFAGHPTIGTAIALHDLGYDAALTLHLGIGPIPCQIDGNSAAFQTAAALKIIAEPDPSLVAACLSLEADQIKTDTHLPTQASIGLPFVLVELTDHAALQAATPAVEVLREAAKDYPAGLDFAIYCYIRDNNAIHARMFAPLDNIPEDPATGSAAATLAMMLTTGATAPIQFHITQGTDMGRPSTIHATSNGKTCTIRGQAVRVMQGQLVT